MKNIALASTALALAALSGLATAQGDGGSQTSCELKFSTCKQTARADYQFCLNLPSSGTPKNCTPKRDAALRSCSAANTRCQNQSQN